MITFFVYLYILYFIFSLVWLQFVTSMLRTNKLIPNILIKYLFQSNIYMNWYENRYLKHKYYFREKFIHKIILRNKKFKNLFFLSLKNYTNYFQIIEKTSLPDIIHK